MNSEQSVFGFLNIYKPVGMTSHDVVAILRRITKIKQIGHTGTLDPFAQGVLPIAIGKATRLIEYLDDDKEYLAEVTLGKSTNTYDCEGETTFTANSCAIAKEQIEKALEAFRGEIQQIPPIFSAIKVKGKKLYEYARKGEEVEIQPRTVTIEKIELKSFDFKAQKAEILIQCSKGTYIRSIAHDLGQNLGCGAHLSRLIRTKAGKFFIDKTLPLDKIETIEDVKNNLINPLDMVCLPKVEINGEEYKRVFTGQSLNNKNNLQNTDFIILIYNENISAIAQVQDNLIKVKKVFG